MYITSFIHRETLFEIAGRWFCDLLSPEDGLRLTQILISDGFVLGETLQTVASFLLGTIYDSPFSMQRIYLKGELRDMLCRDGYTGNGRVAELIRLYKKEPDFFYKEVPIHGVVCLDGKDRLIGVYRIKRPRRIAEKANRYVANWIFKMVQGSARRMAERRAASFGIPLEKLLTTEAEMVHEFVKAEEAIAGDFRQGKIDFDKTAMAINDVAGIKIVADDDRLSLLEERLTRHPILKIVERATHQGDYEARSFILEMPWDREQVCRAFLTSRAWEAYRGRGIPDEVLREGLEPFLKEAEPTLRIELILSTFPAMVESELGVSIHEGRIMAQRENKVYHGYIPMNVELLIEYLLAVGLSPEIRIERLPVKLWGRYLPDTISLHIRQLYRLPAQEGIH